MGLVSGRRDHRTRRATALPAGEAAGGALEAVTPRGSTNCIAPAPQMTGVDM